MNITCTLAISLAVVLLMLIYVVKIALKERQEKLAYKSEAERKANTIDYLYKHFEELDKINKQKSEEIQELENAETDEEVLDIVGAVVNRNNELRKQAKKRN